jgi:hypothetical protein
MLDGSTLCLIGNQIESLASPSHASDGHLASGTAAATLTPGADSMFAADENREVHEVHAENPPRADTRTQPGAFCGPRRRKHLLLLGEVSTSADCIPPRVGWNSRASLGI